MRNNIRTVIIDLILILVGPTSVFVSKTKTKKNILKIKRFKVANAVLPRSFSSYCRYVSCLYNQSSENKKSSFFNHFGKSHCNISQSRSGSQNCICIAKSCGDISQGLLRCFCQYLRIYSLDCANHGIVQRQNWWAMWPCLIRSGITNSKGVTWKINIPP